MKINLVQSPKSKVRSQKKRRLRILDFGLWTLGFGLFLNANAAPVPSAEKVLPNDTLFLMTIPDFAKAREFYKTSPPIQFWNDPAMKPLREKITEKIMSEHLQPLERELNIKLSDYTN